MADMNIVPDKYYLANAFPNPFNPSTTINYQLPSVSIVTMSIYNIQGQLTRTLVSSNQSAGYYTIDWNGVNNAGEPVSSGMYLIVINASSMEDGSTFLDKQKVLLLR